MKLIRKFFGVVFTFHYHFHTSSSSSMVWEIEPNFCFYTAAIDARSDMYVCLINCAGWYTTDKSPVIFSIAIFFEGSLIGSQCPDDTLCKNI